MVTFILGMICGVALVGFNVWIVGMWLTSSKSLRDIAKAERR